MVFSTVSIRYIVAPDPWCGSRPNASTSPNIAPLPNSRTGPVGASAYPGFVRNPRQVVDYALQRRSLLADVHAGRVAIAQVCDAGPYLRRAARFHGTPSEVTCPVCRKEKLTEVSWVFGEHLKQVSGSARMPDELTAMGARHPEFSVYVVEVCRSCNWNHLIQSYVLGTPEVSRSRTRRRTASE